MTYENGLFMAAYFEYLVFSIIKVHVDNYAVLETNCIHTLQPGLPPLPLFFAISYKSLLHIENTVQNKIRYY